MAVKKDPSILKRKSAVKSAPQPVACDHPAVVTNSEFDEACSYLFEACDHTSNIINMLNDRLGLVVSSGEGPIEDYVGSDYNSIIGQRLSSVGSRLSEINARLNDLHQRIVI